MKRFLLFLISSCAVVFAYSQGEIGLDSIRGKVEVNRLSLERPLLFENSFQLEGINLLDKSMFNQPLLPDYNKKLDLKKYLDFSNQSTNQSFSVSGFGISPFYTNGIIYNQATYRLNDRFSWGGNSFGAQSVFDRPAINSSVRDMSTKGASMFMQYKVSKNFKVETRVSISGQRSPWEP